MFAKETYVQRRAQLKKTIGSGVLLFLGNDEQGLNYEDNTFRYRQDSTFLYYFGLSFAGLSALIDIDEDKEIIFGDELTIDHIVWMGTQPTLHEKASAVGISETRPFADIVGYLHKAVQKGQTIHYLPPYRAEHKLKLMDWLGIPPARQEGSVPFIRAVVAQRNYKTPEEIEEIEKWEGNRINEAKEVLAFELTKLVHSEEEAIKAQESSRALFSGAAHADMPTTEIEEADLNDGVIDLISLLVKAELAPTRSEARRNIEQGGVTVDGEKVSDVKATFTKDALAGDGMVIKRGKKKFKKVVLK